MSFVRMVSPIEASYLARDTKKHSPCVNQYFFEGKGSLILSDWQRAVTVASRANPNMQLKLKGRWGWRYWDNCSPPPKVIKIASEWAGKHSDDISLLPYCDEPINLRTQAGASVILIDSSKPKVLFRSHHAITDGMGHLHWIRDIFRALNNKAPIGSCQHMSTIYVLKQCGYHHKTTQRENCLPVQSISQLNQAYGVRWRQFIWHGKPDKIVARLMLILRDIAFSQHGKGRVVIRLPTNLRRHLPSKYRHTICNTTGILDADVTFAESPKQIQQDIINQLRQHQDLSVFPKYLCLATWAPKKIFSLSQQLIYDLHQMRLCDNTAMISYVGYLNWRDFSYKHFHSDNAWGIPIPSCHISANVGLNTNINGVTACISSPKATTSHNDLVALCDLIQSKLGGYC